MPEPDFTIKKRDTSSSLFITAEDADENEVDVQGATSIFRMRPIGSLTTVIEDTADIVQNGDGSDGSRGQMAYTWLTIPDTAGIFLGEFEVTYQNGDVQTFPNDGYILINVEEDLG